MVPSRSSVNAAAIMLPPRQAPLSKKPQVGRVRDGLRKHYNTTVIDGSGKRRLTIGWEFVQSAVVRGFLCIRLVRPAGS